jgi:hypothetical protein
LPQIDSNFSIPTKISTKESRRHHMESTKSYAGLLKLGFAPEQIECLRQLRHVYAKRKQVQMLAEQRRLEFARWLVATGRLTDEFPTLKASFPRGTEY